MNKKSICLEEKHKNICETFVRINKTDFIAGGTGQNVLRDGDRQKLGSFEVNV